MSKSDEGLKIVSERFGRDNAISIATMAGECPDVRMVNAYYEDGSIYVVGWKPAIELRNVNADDVTWAILPYVDGQYGN